MSRRPASYVQADFARAIRAARQAGATSIELRIGQATVVVRLTQSTEPDKAIESAGELIL
jgi:hypothetical protein